MTVQNPEIFTDNALTIERTPLVRLNRVTDGVRPMVRALSVKISGF